MTDTEAPRPALSGERLAELMALLRGADTVELKLTIPESYRRSALDALEIDPLEAQLRQVYFFDTPDLTLNNAGVVVRARRIQGEFNDTVVKLRPVEPHQLPERLRKEPMFGVEVDAMPGGFVCSASYKGKLTGDEVPSVVKGTKGINKLFSKEQRAFYRENAPDGLAMNDLAILGPITVAKLKFSPTGYDRRLVAEMWFYPDGGRILELSTKTGPSEAFNVAMETRAFLFERGIDTTGEQQTKTKSALEFFSKELLASS